MPTLPYLKGPDGVGRPVLRVWRDPRVRWAGIVDSGADGSCLPLGIAQDLAVPFDRSVVKQGQGAGGVHAFWTAGEDVELESDAGTIRLIRPTINEHLAVILLGRSDIFMSHRISFDQRAQTFTMTPYKKPATKKRR